MDYQRSSAAKIIVRRSYLLVLKSIATSIFLLPITVFAQVSLPAATNQIKFSALRLIDPRQPGIEISYERLHEMQLEGFQYISSQISFAYLDNIYDWPDGRIPRGFRTSFEEKFFFKSNKREQDFGAFELVYLVGRYRDEILKIDTGSRVSVTDSVLVTKRTASANVKIGVQFLLKPFVIEVSGGLGLKYRLIKYSEKSYPELSYHIPSQGPWGYSADRLREGGMHTINVPFNVKLGFAF